MVIILWILFASGILWLVFAFMPHTTHWYHIFAYFMLSAVLYLLSESLYEYFLLLLLAFIFLIDVYFMIIPDTLTISFLIFSSFQSEVSLSERIHACIIIVGIVILLYFFWKGSFGWGDVKLCMAAAFAYGYAFLSAMRYSILVGGVFALFILLTKRVNLQTRLPFAPWIVFAILFQFL